MNNDTETPPEKDVILRWGLGALQRVLYVFCEAFKYRCHENELTVRVSCCSCS